MQSDWKNNPVRLYKQSSQIVGVSKSSCRLRETILPDGRNNHVGLRKQSCQVVMNNPVGLRRTILSDCGEYSCWIMEPILPDCGTNSVGMWNLFGLDWYHNPTMWYQSSPKYCYNFTLLYRIRELFLDGLGQLFS